ncbi:MAG: hypothetical protein ACT4PO_04985 [Actinomycetota bacterium]
MEAGDRELTPALEAARRRRLDLHDALVGVEVAISRPAPGRADEWALDVGKKLVGLRDAFDEHIQVTERPGGLYEEIMERSPRLAGKIKRLHEEHPTIRTIIVETLGRFEAMEVGDAWPIEESRDDTQRLLGKIVKHRQLGADLVWEAYNLDIGGPE